ncbi:pyruvate kinase [Hymenobacter humi]|uniref:pyruvate kinase n=1 Tax=Hymenobacter humi TaxID=1411620 RepID=A0ABW2UEW6_9BACT
MARQPGRPNLRGGALLLAQHSEAVLGPVPASRGVRIMVTLPTEAATDYNLVRELLREGTDCVRINCAHDDVAVWQQMIAHLRRAEQETGKTCKLCMDLGGAKLRTAGLPPGPAVLRLNPTRDDFGRVLAPTHLWLTSQEHPAPAPTLPAASLALPQAWLQNLRPGEVIRFRDVRGSRRKLRVRSGGEAGWWVELKKPPTWLPKSSSRPTILRRPCFGCHASKLRCCSTPAMCCSSPAGHCPSPPRPAPGHWLLAAGGA